MYQDKVIEYIKSNRSLQMWHKLSDSEIDVLKDFAEWLDSAAEQPRAAVETLICPLCDGKEYFDKEGARDTCPLCGGAGQIKNPSHR